MRYMVAQRPTWREVLEREGQLILPVAHDALAARVLERAGYPAYQIGGFALAGCMYGVPDADLAHYQEQWLEAFNIIAASKLPAMIDADYGYGDVKSVTRTVQGYERSGAAAIFIEDQKAPKKCGHMEGKEVVTVEEMEQKVRAAVAARNNPDFFFLARTDALESEGVEGAIRRAERYLKAGADGVYIEGPHNEDELKQIGDAFKGIPLATSILEGGGKTPFLPPSQFREMGFTMLLYPTTILFQVTYVMEQAYANLLNGNPMPEDTSVTMEHFEEIVDMPYWKQIEKQFQTPQDKKKEEEQKKEQQQKQQQAGQ